MVHTKYSTCTDLVLVHPQTVFYRVGYSRPTRPRYSRGWFYVYRPTLRSGFLSSRAQMLRCNACIRRTLSIVLDGAGRLQPQSQPAMTAARLSTRSLSYRRPLRRPVKYDNYAAAASQAPKSQAYPDDLPAPSADSISHLKQGIEKTYKPLWRIRNGQNKQHSKSIDIPPTEGEVQREIRWLRDPLKHADRVARLLGEDKYFMALALTREASGDLQCIVSWNHLVDFNMAKGDHKAALKTYHEVRSTGRLLQDMINIIGLFVITGLLTHMLRR